jgi:hypothetical protein
MSQAHFERHEHPLLRRNYRVATAAIESFVDLVERCLRVLMPGALVYARPRMGKNHAVDYVCLHLARVRPEVLTIRMSCEHHRTDFEGAFFSSLLIAAGASGDVLKRSITVKRQELIRRLRERLAARKGYIVALFCDEAQRQSRNSYEWLRDVHDQLAYHGIRLITFLIGQPQLLAQKSGFQMSGDEQIVAQRPHLHRLLPREKLRRRPAPRAQWCGSLERIRQGACTSPIDGAAGNPNGLLHPRG